MSLIRSAILDFENDEYILRKIKLLFQEIEIKKSNAKVDVTNKIKFLNFNF